MAPLVEGDAFDGLTADRVLDANWVVDALNERGAKMVASQMPGRKAPLMVDRDICKWRHLIESFFAKLREFERVAMRACKLDTSFAAMILPAAAVTNSR